MRLPSSSKKPNALTERRMSSLELAEFADGQRRRAKETANPAERNRALTRAAKSDAEAKALRGDDDEPPSASSSDGLPHHRVPAGVDGRPKPKAQRNFTDPDSRIMKDGGNYVQGYNCQAAIGRRQGAGSRCVHRDRPVRSRQARSAQERQRKSRAGTDESQVGIGGRQESVRPAQSDSGTGIRTTQGGTWSSAFPATRNC